MIQLMELITEYEDRYGFLMKDVSLCKVGVRSLQEPTAILLDLDRCERKVDVVSARFWLKSLRCAGIR